MYIQIFTVIAPIFFIALMGFIWSYCKLGYDERFVSRLIMNVAAPCLILATMLKADISTDELYRISLITISGLGLLLIANSVLLKLSKASFRTYFSSLTFANTGNMGVPICLFAFGEHGMALALIVFMVTCMFHFSIGVSLAGDKHPLVILLLSPVFYAALLSFFMVINSLSLPKAIFNTVELFGGIAIPLMIFSLGVSLQSLHASSFWRSLFFAVMRLLIGFMVGLALCWLFDLTGLIKGVVLIQSAMPSAVFNYLLAANYQRQPDEIAGVVVFSTLLSFISLPLLLWFVFSLSGI